MLNLPKWKNLAKYLPTKSRLQPIFTLINQILNSKIWIFKVARTTRQISDIIHWHFSRTSKAMDQTWGKVLWEEMMLVEIVYLMIQRITKLLVLLYRPSKCVRTNYICSGKRLLSCLKRKYMKKCRWQTKVLSDLNQTRTSTIASNYPRLS